MNVAIQGHGNMEVRSVFGPDMTRVSRWGLAPYGASGELVSTTTASGLSAVGRAIRLSSGVIASLCIEVFEGERERRRRRDDTWQAELLTNPALGMSDFDWRWDVASALEAEENAFVLKVKDRTGRVVELLPIPLENVRAEVDRQTGGKVFEVSTVQGVVKLSTAHVLHIRGQTVGGGAFGVSRILQHRDELGSMLAAKRFEGSFFKNNARPDIAILFPQGVTREQANQWRQEWDQQYGGPGNAGKPLPLGGGATIQTIPVSMSDAQFVESKRLSVEEVGRIMDVEPVLLGEVERNDDRQQALEVFLRVQLIPRLRRIERGLYADPDLFPVADGLYPRFEVSDNVFITAVDKSRIQHEQIQDGRRLVDEIRAEDGMGPLPPVPDNWTEQPGKIPQITPVGGAPNPTSDESAAIELQRMLEDLDRQIAAERARLQIGAR